MKDIIYKRVYIKSEEDLPKVELGKKHWGHTRSGRMIETDIAWTWRVNEIDFWLKPVELPDDEDSENACKKTPMSEPTISKIAWRKCYNWFKSQILR